MHVQLHLHKFGLPVVHVQLSAYIRSCMHFTKAISALVVLVVRVARGWLGLQQPQVRSFRALATMGKWDFELEPAGGARFGRPDMRGKPQRVFTAVVSFPNFGCFGRFAVFAQIRVSRFPGNNVVREIVHALSVYVS